MTRWKRNLIFVWISQFISIMGFAFALPFAPYYIQQLGVTDPVEVKLWVALFAAATPLGLAIFSPLWGAASDRYGRRLMLLRANFGATLVLGLMGTVRSVEALIILRLMQGALTGTLTAAQTMVAAHTPVHRSGLALGSLSAAVFSGAMTGAFIGGFVANWIGFRAVFFVGATLLLCSAFLVLFGTEEIPAEADEDAGAPVIEQPTTGWKQFAFALPILGLIVLMAFVRQFDMAMMPLLVQEIHGELQGVSLWAGSLFAVSGIAGLLAAVTLGRWADRVHPSRIGMLSAIGAGLAMIPHGLAHTMMILFPARFVMMFCAGGLDPIFQIWLAKVTPKKHRGFIFGWASTAKSIGWVLSPLASGAVAAVYGIRSIYFIGAVLFLLLVPVIAVVVRRYSFTPSSSTAAAK